jgi:hypothetical protein
MPKTIGIYRLRAATVYDYGVRAMLLTTPGSLIPRASWDLLTRSR